LLEFRDTFFVIARASQHSDMITDRIVVLPVRWGVANITECQAFP